MFSDLAVSQGSPVRRWTAMASLTLQSALVGVALVYPLFHIESLPPLVRRLLPPVATFAAPVRPQTNIGHAGETTIHPIVVNITLGFGRSQRQQLMTLACDNRRNLMERSANGIRKDYAQL
jgi:hypothetical protein